MNDNELMTQRLFDLFSFFIYCCYLRIMFITICFQVFSFLILYNTLNFHIHYDERKSFKPYLVVYRANIFFKILCFSLSRSMHFLFSSCPLGSHTLVILFHFAILFSTSTLIFVKIYKAVCVIKLNGPVSCAIFALL